MASFNSSSDSEGEMVSSDTDVDGKSSIPRTSRSHKTRRHLQPTPSWMGYLPIVNTFTHTVVNIITFACAVMIFGVFLYGSHDYFRNVEENKCGMTWMYQKPYYLPISLNANPHEKEHETFSMYKLYVYAEGESSLKAMSREDYKFNGIPVLFIPGNAGSYQQVRSLASVAFWKSLDADTPFHFDFFTVDLNEEFSALYGYVLQRQMAFVRNAITRIVNLYEEYHHVVLVGHSMGGVIAKAVALNQFSGNESTLSNLILTLATPHANPVALFDPEQDIFFSTIKRNWKENSEARSKITLVSVAGGERDYLVLPKLTRWPDSIHTIATRVPGVWASTDHLCIVWCKQLVLTTIRALFDLVEFSLPNRYYAITEKKHTKVAVLKYHFVERHGGKSYHVIAKQNSNALSKNVEQFEATSGIYCLSGGQRAAYVLFPRSFLVQNLSNADNVSFDSDFEGYNVIVLTTNTKEKAWILGCKQTSSTTGQCTQADNLAEYGKIVPHIRRKRKMANIPLSTIMSQYSHLIVKMEPHPFKTCVMLETFRREDRTRPLGGIFPTHGKIFYNLTLSLTGFASYLAAWKVSVLPNNMTCPQSHSSLAQFRHGNFEQTRFLKNESLIVRHFDWNVTSSSVQLFLDPSCNYTVLTTLSLKETAGQFFRVIFRLLPSFYISVILMSLFFQKDTDGWSSFHVVLLSNAYHLTIFPGFVVVILLHLIPTDWPQMMDATEYSVIVPMVCFLVAYCLVLIVSTGTWYVIVTGGTALHSGLVRVLSTRIASWVPRLFSNRRGFTSVTEHITEAAFEMTMTRFPVTIAIILLAVSFASCGSLGIALALALYVVKLFKIYDGLLEDMLKAKILNVTDNLSPMNFHFSCYMLWSVLTVLNVPSLLHWSRSVSSESTPVWDHSMYLCLLVLPTFGILWQDFVPKMEPSIWKLHRYVFYIMGMVCVLWGTHRLYVSAFIITFIFLTLAICQLVSVLMRSLSENINGNGTDRVTQPNASGLPSAEIST